MAALDDYFASLKALLPWIYTGNIVVPAGQTKMFVRELGLGDSESELQGFSFTAELFATKVTTNCGLTGAGTKIAPARSGRTKAIVKNASGSDISVSENAGVTTPGGASEGIVIAAGGQETFETEADIWACANVVNQRVEVIEYFEDYSVNPVSIVQYGAAAFTNNSTITGSVVPGTSPLTDKPSTGDVPFVFQPGKGLYLPKGQLFGLTITNNQTVAMRARGAIFGCSFSSTTVAGIPGTVTPSGIGMIGQSAFGGKYVAGGGVCR
jgi:hypothetical protein